MQCKMKCQLDRIIPNIQWLRFWIAFRKTSVWFWGILKCLVEQKEEGRCLLSREVYHHWKIGKWIMMPKPEELDSEQSSDDEDDHHNLKLIIPESKQKTMADHFEEAFCAASMRDEGILFALPKHLGTGLFGKLQRVMQNEKEREIDFTKRLQAQTSLIGSYFDVRILSKSLEAKLTVCSCSLIEQKESSEWVDNHQIERKIGGTTIIIFSSRLCSDIELEVGNLIRIHPPWKEVQIMVKDEIVILSTYFSQIYT